jgi:hypothetical protein
MTNSYAPSTGIQVPALLGSSIHSRFTPNPMPVMLSPLAGTAAPDDPTPAGQMGRGCNPDCREPVRRPIRCGRLRSVPASGDLLAAAGLTPPREVFTGARRKLQPVVIDFCLLSMRCH